MSGLFPETAPHAQGRLAVGQGHAIAWEVCGNPRGRPVILLHGGPGSGRNRAAARLFDPAVWRIMLFDQRQCGQSTPHAGDIATDLAANTTAHLLEDIAALRAHLAIGPCLVFGHSWGCTLGLAHAQQHPEQVAALLLVGVTTTRRCEIDWLYRGIAPMVPAAWDRFTAGVPQALRGDMVAAYRTLLADPDPGVREKAARDWHDWEASATADADAAPPTAWSDPVFRLCRARIVTHYFHHNGFLEDGILLARAHRLAGIPGVMVQGRMDLEAPLVTAWELDRAWPDGELVLVQGAGHATGDPGMAEAILAAARRLAAHVPG
jgi:proline iminopeptidase